MKNYLIIFFIILAQTLFAYNIDLRINGIKDSKAILARYQGADKMIIDTAYIDFNGNGNFTGSKKLDAGIYICAFNDGKAFEFLIDNDDLFTLISDTSDLFFNLKIEGADESQSFTLHQQNIVKKQKLNSILNEALRRMSPQDKRRDDIEKKLKELKTETNNLNNLFLIEHQGTFAAKIVNATIPIEFPSFYIPDNVKNKDSLRWVLSLHYFKNHFFDNIDLSDNRLLYTPVLIGKINTYFNQIVFQEPDSINKAIDYVFNTYKPGNDISSFLIGFILTNYNSNERLGFEDVLLYVYDNYLNKVNNVYADYKVINEVNFKIKFLQLTAIGQIAPDLNVMNTNNEFISLHRVNSNYTILLFWNPDCPHCEEELKYILTFYEKYKNAGVEIFSLNTGNDIEKWKNTIAEKNMQWINVIDPKNQSKFREIYQVYYTPKLYLLDKDKKILAKTNQISDIERIINQK